MIHALKQVFEFRIFASDGEMGPVMDCYFDDTDWAVRYFVLGESELTTDNKFLIARVAVSEIAWPQKRVYVKETRRKIFDSPEFTEDMPVSRQYEIALHRYFEWPVYWGQLSFLDDESAQKTKMAVPEDDVLEMDTDDGASDEDMAPDQELEGNFREPVDDELQQMEFGQLVNEGTFDPSLRSVRELTGYTVRALEGKIGIVRDFILNDQSDSIDYIVIDSGIQGGNKSFLVPNMWVSEISWQSKEIRANVKGESIVNAPPYDDADPVPEEYIRTLLCYIDGLEEP